MSINNNNNNQSSLPCASPQQQMDNARKLIAKAISVGAPAYNAGNIPGCAKIYRETALEISTMQLPLTLLTRLEETIQRARQDTMDANEEAWAFRKNFDSILEYQIPFVPSLPAKDVTLEKFTDAMIPKEPYVVNDNVMGGLSRGEWVSSSKTFRGSTSLANNGGFSSLRWRFDRLQNWSYANGIYLKGVKHSNPEGHTFRLIVKDATCEQVRGANFKTVFANPESSDDHILIPFETFNQMEQMGRQLSGPVFNRSGVTELGLMAIKPTVVGDFELTIDEWGLYS